jgi:hypothetical protein
MRCGRSIAAEVPVSMSRSENRLPARVDKALTAVRVWELIEADAQVNITCESCGHHATWTRAYMQRKLGKLAGATMIRVALRLRCGCGSRYVRVWRG